MKDVTEKVVHVMLRRAKEAQFLNKRTATVNRCKECGFRIRGAGHHEGLHHRHSKGNKQAPVGKKS